MGKLITSVKMPEDKNYCLCKVHYKEMVLKHEKKLTFTESLVVVQHNLTFRPFVSGCNSVSCYEPTEPGAPHHSHYPPEAL